MSLRGLLGRLLNPGIYAGVMLTALLLVAAYQARPSYNVQLGTPTDEPVLRGFNTREVLAGDKPIPFRWTRGDSHIILQDVGRQDFDVTLTIGGARPARQPAPRLIVQADSRTLLDVAPSPDLKDYTFSVPREAVRNGTLDLHLTTNAFTPAGDPRDLGVVMTAIRVAPSANPDRFIEPPAQVLAAIIGASALLGLALAAFGWGAGAVGVGSGAVGGLAAWLLVSDRLWLTSQSWYLAWPQAIVAGAVISGALWAVGGWLLRRSGVPWTAWQRRMLLSMVLLACAIRLAGQLHPQIYIVDLGFHLHRFETVESGQLLFTIPSAEWGGHQTFYLPTVYVYMLPLYWLINDKELVIKLVTVALGTLGVFPLFYLARRAVGDGRAGLIAAALYLSMPIGLLPFSWGITSNEFGEFFSLCSLAIAVGAYKDLRPNRPAFWALLFTLLMALLSHPGVVQLSGLAFGLITLLWLVWRPLLADRRGAAWTLIGLAAAAGIAYVFYYGHFAADMLDTLQQIQRERAAQATPGVLHIKVGGSVQDKSLGLITYYVSNRAQWLTAGLEGFWREAVAYYHAWPIAGALLGYMLIWPARRLRNSGSSQARTVLILAAGGWLLTVLLFAIVGWVMNLYVRYALFALPVVALGSALLLSRLCGRGRGASLLSALMLMLFAIEMLALWQYRINYALK